MAMARPSLLHHSKPLNKISFAQKRCLSLHEYQAQHLLAQSQVPVPRGWLSMTATEVASRIRDFGGRGVIKSQVLAGGRGKGAFGNGFEGGVHVVSSAEEGRDISTKMLGQRLFTNQTPPQGLPVNKVYVVEQLAIEHEYYLSITTDRPNACPVLIMSQGGGTGIEDLAAKDPKAVVKVPLKYTEGVTAETVSLMCERFALQADRENLTALLQRLFAFFKKHDATLVEINPLIRESKTGRFICADSKVSIDNAASKRQSQIFGLRDHSQEMAVELEAEKHGLVYIQLEGNIGCLVNGAGLAMATNDAVAYHGGKCAKFLDGGGQATKETMVKAFELILSDKKVNTIFVNIYGGIIRCDMIAESIIAAAQNFNDIPIVVRLQGTNAAEGQKMIAESGLKLFAEDGFGSAVRKVIELAGPARVTTAAASPRRETQARTKASGNPRTGSISHQTNRTFSSISLRRTSPKLPSIQLYSKRSMATTSATLASSLPNTATIPNLSIGPDTKLIYQGFTGKAATLNALATLSYGTKILGGVSPSAQSPTSTPQPHPQLAHFPTYPTVRLALSSLLQPPTATAAAILEAFEAEIPLIVSVAEHVPLHDMFRVHAALRTQSRSRLVGPNCPGIIRPPATCRIGIMPHLQYTPGCVGIVSKSGTLSYEAVGATTREGLGQSLCIGVGGDMVPGTSLRDGLEALLGDEATRGVVLMGEIGGEAEIEAAGFLEAWNAKEGGESEPVVGMVTARTAPRGRVMGHAGAGAVAGGSASAEDKVRALEAAGVRMAVHPGEIGVLMREMLEEEESRSE